MSLLINKKIKQKQLLKLLNLAGYQNVRVSGSHLIYKHDNSKSVIALRNARNNEIVPIFIVSAVYRNIVDNGVLSTEQLIELLETL